MTKIRMTKTFGTFGYSDLFRASCFGFWWQLARCHMTHDLRFLRGNVTGSGFWSGTAFHLMIVVVGHACLVTQDAGSDDFSDEDGMRPHVHLFGHFDFDV